jgi:hypothetical protein
MSILTINKYVLGVALAAAGCFAISEAVSQSLTPEVESKARRLLRDQMFQLHHSEWRAGLQPVDAAQTMAYATTLTPEREATARQMLRQKMAELYAQDSPTQAIALARTLTPELEVRARQMVRQRMLELYGPGREAQDAMLAFTTPGPLTPALETRARQMLRERMSELYAQDAAPKPRLVATIRPGGEALYPMPASTETSSTSANTPLEQLKRYYITGQIGPQQYYREAGRLAQQR